jgi:hypothetical protein
MKAIWQLKLLWAEVKHEVVKQHRTFIEQEVQILEKEVIGSKYFEVLYKACRKSTRKAEL